MKVLRSKEALATLRARVFKGGQTPKQQDAPPANPRKAGNPRRGQTAHATPAGAITQET